MTPGLAPENVEGALAAQPDPLRRALSDLRDLILETAAAHPEIGPLEESLKWAEPAWRPKRPRVGTTVRINAVKGHADRYALYINCRTSLAQSFKLLYPGEFIFEGERAILFKVGEPVPRAALCHCIALALTYHLSRR